MEDSIPLPDARALGPDLEVDLERNDDQLFLMNRSVQDFSWSGLTVTVKDRQTKQARDLICDISGDVQRGEPNLRSRTKITLGSTLILTLHRRAGRPDGPIGMWKDDPAQRAGTTPGGIRGKSAGR